MRCGPGLRLRAAGLACWPRYRSRTHTLEREQAPTPSAAVAADVDAARRDRRRCLSLGAAAPGASPHLNGLAQGAAGHDGAPWLLPFNWGRVADNHPFRLDTRGRRGENRPSNKRHPLRTLYSRRHWCSCMRSSGAARPHTVWHLPSIGSTNTQLSHYTAATRQSTCWHQLGTCPGRSRRCSPRRIGPCRTFRMIRRSRYHRRSCPCSSARRPQVGLPPHAGRCVSWPS